MTLAIHLPPYSQKMDLLSIARDSGVYASESRDDLPRCTADRRGIVSNRRRNADSHLAKGYKVGEDPCFRGLHARVRRHLRLDSSTVQDVYIRLLFRLTRAGRRLLRILYEKHARLELLVGFFALFQGAL